MGYQGINTNVWASFFCARPFFVPREHCWGDHIYMGKNMGSQFAAWDEIEITVLGVPKLQKTIPRNVELPATLCRSVA